MCLFICCSVNSVKFGELASILESKVTGHRHIAVMDGDRCPTERLQDYPYPWAFMYLVLLTRFLAEKVVTVCLSLFQLSGYNW